MSVMSSFSLSQVMSEPTRVVSNSSSLIDLAFVSFLGMVQLCETLPPLANSDHLGVHLKLSARIRKSTPKPHVRRIWRYNYADFDKAMELLDEIEWESLLNESDVDLYWSALKNYFLQVMEVCIPNAIVKVKKDLPWLNHDIKKAIQKRDSLYRRLKRSGTPANRGKYSTMRNRVVYLMRESKRNFFNKLNQATTKEFWKLLKLLNHNHDSTIPTLEDRGTSIDSSIDKANALNRFFYSCFNNNCPVLSECSSVFELEAEYCPKYLLSTEESVFDLLANLDVTKSTGCDGISPKMLKSTASSIALLLSKLINLSISTGKFPKEWKLARVVPIPKGKSKSSLGGYRPISILPVVTKIIERHVGDLILAHLSNYAPISPRQWGFMTHRSSVSALIKVFDNWAQALDEGHEICVIFFDVRKAFDRVPHQLLLQQMQHMNLSPYLLRWLHDYLSNRSQFVAVEGEKSSTLPVISGVPQGSVLGPLLFITYINDVVTVVSPESEINMFADDIALYRVIKAPGDYTALQGDVDSIGAIVTSKHLEFNTDKCRMMVISRKRSNLIPSPPLYLNGSQLDQVKSYKYLGVTITSNLSWLPHITSLCNKTRRLVGMVYRKFYQHSDSRTLLKLYLSIIRPHIEYASPVWDPYHKTEIEAIESVQKFALKMCLKSWSSNYEQLLLEARLPTLKVRSELSLGHLYKIINKLTYYPEPPIIQRKIPYRNRGINANTVCIPHATTTAYQQSFYPKTLTMWNSLPEGVTSCTSITGFKRHLKQSNLQIN